MSEFGKPPTEYELLDMLREGVSFRAAPPVKLKLIGGGGNELISRTDGRAELTWGEFRCEFFVECKSRSTPKVFEQTVEGIQITANRFKEKPLVVMPFLSDNQIDELAYRGISGIDLSGNALIVVPEKLLIRQTGRKNKYPRTAKIKNVFSGKSALVTRTFLLTPEFESTSDAWAEVQRRGGDVNLATVSKVCDALEQLLIIERTRGRETRMRLLQADKLLDNLRNEYKPINEQYSITGKLDLSIEEILKRLQKESADKRLEYVLAGASSVNRYAVMASEPINTIYGTSLNSLVELFKREFREEKRFANIRFVETKRPEPYFDSQEIGYASIIQTYLELATGDKRQSETAEQVSRLIIERLRSKGYQ